MADTMEELDQEGRSRTDDELRRADHEQDLSTLTEFVGGALHRLAFEAHRSRCHRDILLRKVGSFVVGQNKVASVRAKRRRTATHSRRRGGGLTR